MTYNSRHNWSEIEGIEKQSYPDGQSLMEKWYSWGNDVRNRSVHEKSLSISLFRIVSTNFEEIFSNNEGRNVILKPELQG